MDIFDIFKLCGGLAFFLYGMNVMSSGLEKMAGGSLERTLKRMTSSRLAGLLLGAVITVAIQSSSAMTVMLVGFVNSGIMQLGNTVAVIMGSNIGTTLTAWLLSLTGIQGDNVFLRLLRPESFTPVLALVGIIMMMAAKSPRKRDVGHIMLGFSVLMYGMQLMSGSVSGLADMPEFTQMITMFNNPLLGVLVGTVVTGVIQSSAASVGILQALSLTGALSYNMAVPIIMGQNIGTCVTALLSSIGTNKNAKRVAAVHVWFNVIGTAVCLSVYYLLRSLVSIPLLDSAITPFGIALAHSIFNVATTALLLPFCKQLEKLACLTIPDKSTAEEYEFIDERLLLSPAFAIAECRALTVKMAKLARDTLLLSIDQLSAFSESAATAIEENEELADRYEDKLGTYLVKLSSKELTAENSNAISELLHAIGDFERISDHAVNVLRSAREMHEKDMHFSAAADSELSVMIRALREILNMTVTAFENDDTDLAARVEPLEQVIDALTAEIKARHIMRLKQGLCTIELGFVLSDLLSNFGRVSDHCSNIAVCVIQIKDSAFDTHDYLNERKTSGEPRFTADFNDFRQQYRLS